jgi:hypothetical protein
MLSATVMCGHSAYDWNIIAVSRFSGGRPRMSRPSTRIAPASGVTKPAMERRRVVLPQPELPSSATSSPRCDVEAHVAQDGRGAVGHRQRLDREIRGHG